MQEERPDVDDSRRFRRRHRLLDSQAFSRVFKQAARSRDRMFTVLYKDNGSQEARLGLAISKKHCKLAVGRNRLKRLVRESFRQHRASLAGLDIVVLNQPDAQRAGNKALFASLERHWHKCHAARTGRADG